MWAQGLVGGLLLAGSVLIPLDRGGCRVEAAHLEQVDGIVRVLAVLQCGGVTCWERWLISEDRELGSTIQPAPAWP